MSTVLQDIRYSLRLLARAPVFTTVVVATLALGIGANTAIFTLINSILLRPAPFSEPDRLVAVWTHFDGSPSPRSASSPPDVLDWRDQSEVFEEFGYFHPRRNYNVSGSEAEPQRIVGGRMSATLLPMLRVEPLLGRSFLPEEDVYGTRTVAMLTHGFWQDRFGGDESIVGKSIDLDHVPYEIVGVLPATFHLESPAPELWVPFSQEGAVEAFGREVNWLSTIGRLKQEVSIDDARASLELISATNREMFPETNEYSGVFVEPLSEAMAAGNQGSLLIIWLAAGFVLLIACTNVANLMIGRLGVRGQEVAVRAAIGAARSRLIRQFLTEALVLAGLGGVLGVMLASVTIDSLIVLLTRTIGGELPAYVQDVTLDGSVLLYALVTTAVTGVLFGLLPAVTQSQTSVSTQMIGTGRIAGKRSWLRNALIVAETALSMILLVGVGLLLSSFVRSQQIDVGFDVDRIAVVELELPRTEYAEQAGMGGGRQLFRIKPSVAVLGRELSDALESLPSVESIALASNCCSGARVKVQEASQKTPAGPFVRYQNVSPDYFAVMGISLLEGRVFEGLDSSGVAIVNAAFARTHFGDGSALGKTLTYEEWRPGVEETAVIVGVVSDSLSSPRQIVGVRPQFYLPFDGQPSVTPGNMRDSRLRLSFMIRATGSPSDVLTSAKQVVSDTLPRQPISKLKTLSGDFADLLAPHKMTSQLVGSLAFVAILLTALGLYGVVSYWVRERTRELGIRLALGAERAQLQRSVLVVGWKLTGYGVVIGGIGALALTKLLENQIFVMPGDRILTFTAMAIVLMAVAAVSAYIPARRASRLDPITVLRYE